MSDSIPPFWVCPKCNTKKPFTEKFFYKDPTLIHGLSHTCIICYKEICEQRRKANPQKTNERAKKWRDNNPEKVREANHRSELKNNEKRKAIARQVNQTHPEGIRARKQRYNQTDKGRLKNRIYLRNRRALKIADGGKFTLEEIIKLGDQQNWKCRYCTKDITNNYHIDHYIPLKKGGRNDIGNIVLACPFCNQSKRDKMPEDFTPH